MVERIPFGEHPVCQALAYNCNEFAAVAVGIVEIASFDDWQAKRREKPG